MKLFTCLISSALILSIACAPDARSQPDSSPTESESVLFSDEDPRHDTADGAPFDLSPTPAPPRHDTASPTDCMVAEVHLDVTGAATSAANTVAGFLPILVQTIHNAYDASAVNNALIQATEPASPPTVDRAADVLSLSLALPSTPIASLDTAFREFLENGDGVATPRADQEIEGHVNAIIDGTTTTADGPTRSLANRIQASYDSDLGRSLNGAFALLPSGVAPAGVSSGRDLSNFAAIAPVDSLLESSRRAGDFAREATDRFSQAYRAYSLVAAAAHHVDVVATGADACDTAVRAAAALEVARLAVAALESFGDELGSVMLASRREAGNAVTRYRATYYGATPW